MKWALGKQLCPEKFDIMLYLICYEEKKIKKYLKLLNVQLVQGSTKYILHIMHWQEPRFQG